VENKEDQLDFQNAAQKDFKLFCVFFYLENRFFLNFYPKKSSHRKNSGWNFPKSANFFRGNISFNPMSSEAALEMSPSGQTNCLFIVLFIQKFQNIPKNFPLLSFSFFRYFWTAFKSAFRAASRSY